MASSTNARDLKQIVRDGLSTLVFAFGHKTGIVNAFIEIQQPCSAEELSQKAGKKLSSVNRNKPYKKLIRAKCYQKMHIWVLTLIKSYAIFRCSTYCHDKCFFAILSFDKILKVH